jgi:GAF domain-containing protein
MARPSRTGGKASEAKARNASSSKGRKTTKTKRRIAPGATRAKRGSVSDPSKDLKEAREQQAATAEILKVIASSPDDVQPVFEAVAERAMRLLDAWSVLVTRLDGELLRFGAARGALPDTEQFLWNQYPMRSEAAVFAGRCVLERSAINISDAQADPSSQNRDRARLRGFRAALSVPMLRAGQPIGVITVSRREAGAFAVSEVELLQTFADQAVIAIENTRLFNETQEALQRQTATADILRVIATSPSDVQPVFKAIAERSKRLVNALSTTVFRLSDDVMHLEAFTSTNSEADAALQAMFPARLSTFSWAESVRRGKVFRVADTEDELDTLRDVARLRGFRSMLLVPLVRDGTPIGLISVTRVEPGPFASHHVDMLQTFADQALIAIENARLFEEVQARTRELTESLQQQTATADVLKVISRSAFDLETVLDALLSSACRLCDADIGTIRYRESGEFRLAATFGCPPEWIEHFRRYSTKPDRSSVFGRTIIEGHIVHIPDLLADPDYKRPEAQKLMGFKAALGVPLTREGEAFGVINLFRFRVSSFEARQIELVQTFADQAVIAIENVRLFEQVQARTRDLSEALTYQTGSANILRVIASSPTDINPVLQAIVESACELCDAYDVIVRLRDGDRLVPSAHHGPIPINTDRWPIERNSVSGRAVIDEKPVHVHDMQSTGADEFPESQQRARELGHRTILSVPLLREGESTGVIALRRMEVNPFTEKQISLLQTFADQAVIAIENTRLFNETQEALERQTATADILKVIASSPDDVQPVFEAIVETGLDLFPSSAVMLVLANDGIVKAAAIAHNDAKLAELLKSAFPVPLTCEFMHAAAILDGRLVDIPDAQSGPDEFVVGCRAFLSTGHRAITIMPMMRGDQSIGALSVVRRMPGSLSDRQLELLKTFADQAVIAIENTRLLKELRERTDDLSESLQQQTATADVLKVISRSTFDLQSVLQTLVEIGGSALRSRQGHHYPPKRRCVLSSRELRLFERIHGLCPNCTHRTGSRLGHWAGTARRYRGSHS